MTGDARLAAPRTPAPDSAETDADISAEAPAETARHTVAAVAMPVAPGAPTSAAGQRQENQADTHQAPIE